MTGSGAPALSPGPLAVPAARRGPVARFLRAWGVSLASLGSGTLTLLVFRRGLPHVGWIVGYLIVLWLLFTLLGQARGRLVAGGRRLVVVAGDYTVQTLYHGLLLFVLPGYFASTTFDGSTAPFFALLAGATLLTTIDPWYRALVHPRPWLGRALCAFALFAGWNVALPLVGVPPDGARLASAALAGLAVTPLGPVPGAGPAEGRAARWRPVLGPAGAGLGGVLLAWAIPAVIPPAPLQLVRPAIARDVVDLAPVGVLRRVARGDLGGGLVAYTPVAAPAGLEQPVTHVWRHEGRPVSTVRLASPVRGGRATGWRTYSRKTDFPPDAAGRWTVDVLTPSGQLIGRLRFVVDP